MPKYTHEQWAQSFWTRVDRNGPVPAHCPELGSCWLWTGDINRRRGGYGAVRHPDRRILRAHRVAWMLTFGEIETRLAVLHKCDNPPCVRPDHLFVGTDQDNANDRMRKGRFQMPSHTANNLAKTACAHGHPLTGSNVYFRPSGGRACRECQRAAYRRYHQKRGSAWRGTPTRPPSTIRRTAS